MIIDNHLAICDNPQCYAQLDATDYQALQTRLRLHWRVETPHGEQWQFCSAGCQDAARARQRRNPRAISTWRAMLKGTARQIAKAKAE
jgi:predicted transposase YbfD/YdcC